MIQQSQGSQISEDQAPGRLCRATARGKTARWHLPHSLTMQGQRWRSIQDERESPCQVYLCKPSCRQALTEALRTTKVQLGNSWLRLPHYLGLPEDANGMILPCSLWLLHVSGQTGVTWRAVLSHCEEQNCWMAAVAPAELSERAGG